MRAFRFKHRLHLEKHKGKTENMEIQSVLPKEGDLLKYPLLQHSGSPAVPLVKKGDKVLSGQKIAEGQAEISANIHSGVSGIVFDIAKVLDPHGDYVESIIIQNDGNMEEHPAVYGVKDLNSLTREEYLEIIKEAGIVGLGGAGFPTHIKLSPEKPEEIEYIIVNGAECEPYHTNDYRVMLEKPGNIRESLNLLLKFFPNAKIILAIETNKMPAIILYEELFKSSPRINVARLVPRYPQGSEKQLIESTIKRQVPRGKLPLHIRVIVINVSSVAAIDSVMRRGRPVTRRIITLSGEAFANPGNYEACVGMSYRSLIEGAGGFKTEPYKIISGGAMMGFAVYDLDVPIVKKESAILAFTKKESDIHKETPCIRCAKCVEYCPMGLMPYELNAFVLNDDLNSFTKMHGMDCIHCGACSYTCPSKRHLAQSILAGKNLVSADRINSQTV